MCSMSSEEMMMRQQRSPALVLSLPLLACVLFAMFAFAFCGEPARAQTTERAQDTILDWKDSVRVATTAALPANTLSGNTMTASANGALGSRDGIALARNDRVLVKDESSAAKNGIYFVLDLGSSTSKWRLGRAPDADQAWEVSSGLACAVEAGTVNGGKVFLLTTANPITLNTTAIAFGEVGGGGFSGPGSSTDNALARYDGTTGALLQNGLVTESDTGSLSIPAGQTVDGRDLSVDGARIDGLVAVTTDEAICRYNGTTGGTQNSLVTVSDSGSISLPAAQTIDGRDPSVDGARLDGFTGSSTDNAICRYNGTTGGTQDSSVIVSDDGNFIFVPLVDAGSLGIADATASLAAGSTLFGYAADATGTLASVFGHGASVTGSGGSAYGEQSLAAGESTALGHGAQSTAGLSVCVGAVCTVNQATSVGVGAQVNITSASGVATGWNATALNSFGGVAYGSQAASGGQMSGAYGFEAAAANNWSIALGGRATTTADNQFVVGSNTARIGEVRIGNGVTNASPLGFTIQATSGSGTNIPGASVSIAGGQGTGSGTGGGIVFQTSAAGASGTTLRSLVDRLTIDTTGLATFTGNVAMAALATVDGRDVSVDGTKLDGIEAGAQVANFSRVSTALAAATSGVAFNSQNLSSIADLTTAGNTVLGDAAADDITIAGDAFIQSTLALQNDISPTTLSADVDNYAPTGVGTATVLRVGGDALNRTITGITGGADGRIVKLVNIGTQNVLLTHDATSTAANRFFLPNSVNFTILPNTSCSLIYDATSSRWRIDSSVSGLWLDQGSAIGGGSHGTVGTQATCVGYGCGNAGTLSVAAGFGANASAGSAVSLGAGTSCDHTGAICIGRSAISSAANQTTIGSATLFQNNVRVIQGANSQALANKVYTESHTLAAAATSDTTITIPAQALAKWVTVRVTTAITGCTTWDVGVAGATNRYGDDLAVASGTTNSGPDSGGTPRFYTAATAIRFTCNGGTFSAGVVRVTIHDEEVTVPAS